jgi:hypothetical protein
MSILLVRVVWYQIDSASADSATITYQNPIDITDAVSFNAGKGLDIKNNILSMSLRNDWQRYVSDTTSEIMFKEEDQIKLYLKYVDDNDDIDATWDVNSATFPTSSDLMGVYYIKEFGVEHGGGGARIKLSCVDKTYILFNRVFSKAWRISDAVNAPELVKKIVRTTTQGRGEFSDGGVNYEIDARLVSEGGLITDTRASAPTTFPDVEIAKVWKPVYDWIKELSSVDYINSSSEIANQTYVYGRPFIFWVDEENRFHWQAPSYDSPTALTVGTSNIYSVNLTKEIFGTSNMIIYNGGEGMDGRGIWSYYLDESSNIQGLQMRVVPMTHIARDLIARDYQDGVIEADRKDGGDGFGLPFPQYPKDAEYPLSACVFPSAALATYNTPSDITSDATYRAALKERVLYECEQLSKRITAGLAHAKWRGKIEVKGAKYTPGDLISLTDSTIGLNAEQLRLMDVRHSISQSGWFTSLVLEKDPETLEVT